MDNKKFYSKVLLFGEYGVLSNSNALSIPFGKFYGYLNKSDFLNNEEKISNYNIIQSIIFNGLFYFSISMIFLSKRLVDRGMKSTKIFLFVLSIFLYYLLVPKIMLNNFQHLFQLISIMILFLIFFKIKQYE